MTAASIHTPRHPTPPLEYKAAVATDEVGELEHKRLGEQQPNPGGVLNIDRKEGLVTAIVSVTGIDDYVNDNISPGAYAETLAKRRPKVAMHHDWKQPVGRVEEVKELPPGDPGLPEKTADGKPWPKSAGALVSTMRYNLNTTAGKDAFESVAFYTESGECEWSIGYRVPKGGAVRRKDGVREIKSLDLYEISFVLFGAAPYTSTLAIKSGEGETGEGDAEQEDGETTTGETDLAPESAPGPDGQAEEDPYAVTDEELAAVDDEATQIFGAADSEDGADDGPADQDAEDPAAPTQDNGVPAEGEGTPGQDGQEEIPPPDEKAIAAQPLFDPEIKRAFGTARRRQLAKQGAALPDGSFPIENAGDLKNAIIAFGRAPKGKRAQVRAHIMKRARALGQVALLPEGWSNSAAGSKTAVESGIEAKLDSMAHESLNRSPRKNWVELAGDPGQLPAYIQHIAKDIHEQKGVPLEVAIPTAIAAVKRWAAGGGNVNADTRAKAAAAVAEWEKLKAASHARSAARGAARAAKTLDIPAMARGYDPLIEVGPDAGHKTAAQVVESVLYPHLPGTFEEIKASLLAAIRRQGAPGADMPYMSIDATWPDRAVVTWFPAGQDAKSYEVPYRIEDGAVWLGEPAEVKLFADGDADGGEVTPQAAMLEEATDGLRALLHESKAGRVLSDKNAKRLRGAVEQLIAVLGAAGIEVLAKPDDGDGQDSEDAADQATEQDSTAPSARVGTSGKAVLDPALRARALKVYAATFTGQSDGE